MPTWLVFSCLAMSHFRGDPRASDLTLFLYSQNLWLTKPSLRIRLTRSQKIENGLTVLEWSWMMIFIKFLNSFTNLLLTFDERGVGARSMSKQKISGVLPWDTLWDTNLPANERQHHLVSTNISAAYDVFRMKSLQRRCMLHPGSIFIQNTCPSIGFVAIVLVQPTPQVWPRRNGGWIGTF